MIILPKDKVAVGKLTNPIKNINTTSTQQAVAQGAATTQAAQVAQVLFQDTDLLDIYWAYEYQADLDLPTQLIIEVNPSKYGNSAIQNNSTNPNISIGSGTFPSITLPVQAINFIGAGVSVSRSVGSGNFITVAPIYSIEIDDLSSNEISVKIYFEEVAFYSEIFNRYSSNDWRKVGLRGEIYLSSKTNNDLENLYKELNEN